MEIPGKGWKVAYLIEPKEMLFRGLFYGVYSLESKFSCYKNHELPTLDCTCGFHTYNTYEDAYLEHLAHPGSVILSCELFGTIVLHSYGSRGEEQLIKEIHYDGYCSKMYCQRKATGFSLGSYKKRKSKVNEKYYDTFCKKHITKLAAKNIEVYEFSEINKKVPSQSMREDFLLRK